jgi:glycosyltransferase involved in cell wall biosynthesis
MRIVLFDLNIDGHHLSYASYLIRYLQEKGCSVAFVTLKPDYRITNLIEKYPGLIVEYVGDAQSIQRKDFLRKHLQTLHGLQRCFEFANRYEADVVHLLYMDACDIPLCFLRHRLRGRTWRLFGTLWWLHFIHTEGDDVTIKTKIYHKIRPAALRRVFEDDVLNTLFVHTERIKETLLRYYRWSKHFGERVVVVPDAVETPDSSCSQEEARKKLNLPLNIPILLYFGALDGYKGPDTLFAAIKNVHQNFALVMAGPSGSFTQDDVNRWKKDISESVQVIDRIEFVPEYDVLYYFTSADGVVLSYRKSFKSTSGILQHAAGARKPVIVHDVGEIGKTVRDFSLGILVNPDSLSDLSQAIEHFLSHRKEITEQVIPNAIRYTEQQHWRVMTSKVEEAYLTQWSRNMRGITV